MPEPESEIFLVGEKKNQSSAVPIGLLAKKNPSVISLKTSWTVCSQLLSDFWWLLWALDRLLKIYLQKKIWLQIAPNPYEFWHAFEARVAMTAYPMPTRCSIFSRFEATFWFASLRFTSLHFASLHYYQVGKGVDTLGGLPPPQAPPGRIVPMTLRVILLTSFPSEKNIYGKCLIDFVIWSIRNFLVGLENFMINRKILPTSFRENLNKNSLIEVFMWCNRDFSANLNKLYNLTKKASENEL